MAERRCIVYVGMDLFPPYNEIQSKTVHTLVRNLPPEQPYRVLSFANPDAAMGPAPDLHHVAVPGRGRVGAALGLTTTLLRETWQRRGLVHFVMPAHHQAFVALLLWLCWMRRVPTILTIMKRKTRTYGLGRASILVMQTRAAFEQMRAALPNGDVRLVVPGSAETTPNDGHDRGKTVLFVGVPWNDRDLERRGVLLFFDVVRETLRRDPEVHFTLLNRAQRQEALLNRLAAEFPRQSLSVHHGSFSPIADWYAKSSVFLVLHLDSACPDPPLSAIEACCCGCAVVTTRFNGLSQDFVEAGAGIETDTTATAVTDGILRVLAAPASFRENALSLGRAQYSEAAFCRAYAEIYAALQGVVDGEPPLGSDPPA